MVNYRLVVYGRDAFGIFSEAVPLVPHTNRRIIQNHNYVFAQVDVMCI